MTDSAPGNGTMQFRMSTSIHDFSQDEWNRVAGTDYPFLRYEFLSALEKHGCVGERHGWLPRFLSARNADGRLTGLVPLYLKTNSYGEFVFDWSWADAYERQGLSYYPKAVVAIPYTPVTGPRLLIDSEADRDNLASALIDFTRQMAEAEHLSSLHWLFTDREQTRWLKDRGLLLRLGCQFHWRNQGYETFDDFLACLSARKRKKIKRERRQVRDADIHLTIVHGHEADEALLATMSDFYRITFEKKWGYPTLTQGFFHDISTTMGEQVVFVVAKHASKPVAGAICLRSQETLYGRHWGCYANYHSLHFEACYYQGIDYCIEHGLRTFEPGAQGEHKISRGFLPTATWSAHWIAEADFARAISQFLTHEQQAMEAYMKELAGQSPYKSADSA